MSQLIHDSHCGSLLFIACEAVIMETDFREHINPFHAKPRYIVYCFENNVDQDPDRLASQDPHSFPLFF